MKTYESEQMFVENFAKDCKSELKSNGQFEAEWNGINITVTKMDNNNSSKVTVYSGSVNGIEFSGSITALKKRLNVTYTKEYNRNSESTTKVAIKSDEELQKTAETAAKRIADAVNGIRQAAWKYGLSRADMLERTDSVGILILEALKRQRDRAAKEREDEAARKAEESAKKLEREKKKLEKQLAELQAKLSKMK